jgi:ABC-type lipoprotein export system ATPase subunit
MWKLLGDIRSRHGTTVMIATHDVTLAELADRPLELADGHLVSPEQPSPTIQGVT